MQFCERRLCEWVVEPSNGWSNLAYIFIGFYVLWLNRQHLRSALTTIGISAILVGIGSFGLHGTGTFVGEVLDVSAMYLISGLFIVFNIRRRWAWSDRNIVAFYVILVALSVFQLVLLHYNGIAMFAAQVTAAGLIEINLIRRRRTGREASPRPQYKYLLLLCGFFTVAFISWSLDITGVMCDPDNHVFTGHAFWHVSNSFCLLFFYLFQRQFFAGLTPGYPLQLRRQP